VDRAELADFDTYRDRWPGTPPLALPDRSLTARLLDAEEPSARLDGLCIPLVRGFLGNWMPGNLVRPAERLRADGADAFVVRSRAGGTVAANARALVERLRGRPRVLLAGHSRGGLECLLALEDPDLRTRTVGVLLSQTPRGPSGVLESLLDGQHASTRGWKRSAEELTQRAGLYGVLAARGGRELVRPALTRVVERADAVLAELSGSVPVWQTASWSARPTTWLDSFHERLGEIRPGCAHDGQFFLEDLIWPGLPHVLLAGVDHAQPAMGGFGFDHARYWRLLVHELLVER
jgi:hypothetical protein